MTKYSLSPTAREPTMLGEVRAGTDHKSVTLTMVLVRQSQTIKMLTEAVATKSINLEAVIFAHETSTLPGSKPVFHKMVLPGSR